MLRKLSKEDQDRICSQQVITELRDCIKELVDNSIDAECKEIIVNLTDNGASTIEVIDNGHGISDLEMVGERGNTSKLESFDHINISLDTLGFRGEGLNSIVNSCEIVEIDTRFDKNGLNNYRKIVFERGKVISDLSKYQEYNFVNETGTRIKIMGLFFPYISRRTQLLKNIKNYLRSLILLLEEYAICYPKIRFLLSNKILSDLEREKIHIKLTELNYKQQQKTELLVTRGNTSSQLEVAQYLWGKSILGDSIAFNLNGEIFVSNKKGPQISNSKESEKDDLVGGKWFIDGFISSIDKGRPSPDHQIFTMNRRPINPIKRISKSISSIYSTLSSFSNRRLYPAFVINIKIPPSLLDINVTPNKRVVMLPSLVESALVESIHQYLLDHYQNSVPIKNNSNIMNNKLYSKDNSIMETNINENIPEETNNTNSSKKRSISQIIDLEKENELNEKKKNQISCKYIDNSVDTNKVNNTDNNPSTSSKNEIINNEMIDNKVNSYEQPKVCLNNKQKKPFKFCLNYNIPVSCIIEYKYQTTDQEKKWRNRQNKLGNRIDKLSSSIDYLVNEDILNLINKDEKNASYSQKNTERSFNFEKHLFDQLEVIGQFNKGFILTKLLLQDEDFLHIFIIDQHASDEKAKFERLNKEYNNIQTQKLISPLPITLTPSQEQVVLNYKDIIENNGFKFIFNENLNIGSRIQLIQLPVVLGIPLKHLDFIDLVSQINQYKVDISIQNRIPSLPNNSIQSDNSEEDSITISDDYTHKNITLWCPLGLIPRPKKIWSILASKACRTAVMIGDDLNHAKMKSIVKTMSTLNSPWNCPHGRPSIRHLGYFKIISRNMHS